MPEITHEYRGHILTYNEDRDTWDCPDFANHRGSETLKLAKARIDKIEDDEPKKPKFAPFDVYVAKFHYESKIQKVRIAAKTEDGFWATKGTDRRKLSAYDVSYGMWLDTPENAAILAQMDALESQRKELAAQSEKLKKTLKPYTP